MKTDCMLSPRTLWCLEDLLRCRLYSGSTHQRAKMLYWRSVRVCSDLYMTVLVCTALCTSACAHGLTRNRGGFESRESRRMNKTFRLQVLDTQTFLRMIFSFSQSDDSITRSQNFDFIAALRSSLEGQARTWLFVSGPGWWNSLTWSSWWLDSGSGAFNWTGDSILSKEQLIEMWFVGFGVLAVRPHHLLDVNFPSD